MHEEDEIKMKLIPKSEITKEKIDFLVKILHDQILYDQKASTSARVTAARIILDWGYGKKKEG